MKKVYVPMTEEFTPVFNNILTKLYRGKMPLFYFAFNIMHYKILFFLFHFSLLFSQTSYDKYNWLIIAAQVHKKNGNIKHSQFFFEKAFKYKKPQSSTDLLNYASVCLLNGYNNKAIINIKKSIIEYNAPKEYITSFKEFVILNNNRKFIKFLSNYDFYVNLFYKNLKNPSVYYEVNNLCILDQFTREQANNNDKYFLNINERTLFYQGIIKRQDSVNIKRFIEITNKNGYQPNGWLLLWHQRNEPYIKNNYVWQFFKPLIQNEIEKGNVERSFFAQFEDQAYMFENNGQMQLYGTFDNVEIFDIKNVDKRREDIGLPPLYYDYLIYGSPLPVDYHIDKDAFYKFIFERVKKL